MMRLLLAALLIVILPAQAGMVWNLAPLQVRVEEADLIVVGTIVSECELKATWQGLSLPVTLARLRFSETLKGSAQSGILELRYPNIVGGHFLGQHGIWLLPWDPQDELYTCHVKADPEPLSRRAEILEFVKL